MPRDTTRQEKNSWKAHCRFGHINQLYAKALPAYFFCMYVISNVT